MAIASIFAAGATLRARAPRAPQEVLSDVPTLVRPSERVREALSLRSQQPEAALARAPSSLPGAPIAFVKPRCSQSKWRTRVLMRRLY